MRTRTLKLMHLMQMEETVQPKKSLMRETRLNNKELLEYLPRMPLHQQLFIEIRINGNWIPLFDGIFYGKNKNPITCNLCQIEISPSLFLIHFTIKSHTDRLQRVEQFYHPVYTFAKDKWQLAKGLIAPENDTEEALGKVESSLSKNFHAAKLYLGHIRKFLNLFADVKIPVNEFLQLEFCSKVNTGWKPVLLSDGNQINPKFSCNICLKGSFTIKTLYTHFQGRNHLKAQANCLEIRSRKYPSINKHCMFIAGDKYQLIINNKIAWKHLELPVDNEQIQLIQSHVDGGGNSVEKNEGLIGVEYVVQVTSAEHNHQVVMYECCLCEHVNDTPLSMQLHLIGFDHRLKYCEMHYGKVMDKYKVAIGTINYANYKRTMNCILRRLASVIESHYSRAMPLKVDDVIFYNERLQIMIDIYNLPHASQWCDGPSFENIITIEEINDVKMSTKIFRPPVISSDWCGRFLTLPKRHYLNIEHNHASSIEREMRHYKMPSPLLPFKEHFHNMPMEMSPEREFRDVSPIYINNHQTTAEVAELEDLYREYRKNPESHPEYESEWNDFWKQKRRELLAQGIDHHTYDFQPEWVLYFKNRLEDLYMERLHSIKPNASQDIGRNFDNDDAAGHMSVKHRLAEKSFVRIAKKPRLDRSISNDNRGNLGRRREPSLPPRNQEEDFAYNDNKPNIIHVLRNLSAVEDHLGSLGTKILDLLSEALCLEKSVSNADELFKLMLTPKKCSILELANEKLKGLLFAGLIPDPKIPIFNRIINSTSDLLKYTNLINDDVNNTTFPTNGGGNYRNGFI